MKFLVLQKERKKKVGGQDRLMKEKDLDSSMVSLLSSYSDTELPSSRSHSNWTYERDSCRTLSSDPRSGQDLRILLCQPRSGLMTHYLPIRLMKLVILTPTLPLTQRGPFPVLGPLRKERPTLLISRVLVFSGKPIILWPFHSRIGNALELLTLPPDPLLDVLAYDFRSSSFLLFPYWLPGKKLSLLRPSPYGIFSSPLAS